MKITIDRNMCGAWGPACEECFGTFVLHGFPTDRACLVEAVEDGSPNINAVIRSSHFVGTMTITPENREAVVWEGWRRFCTLPDEAFDIKPPHGDYVREKGRRS